MPTQAEYRKFYAQLFAPIEVQLGAIDANSLVAIIGFDCGGPLNFCTVGKGREKFVTYVSCELAVRDDQKFGETGPFEVMMTCDSEEWVRKVLTDIGRMSLDGVFAQGHTVDISPMVEPSSPIKGLVTEEFARVRIDGRSYGILRFHGVTQPELEFAMKYGTDELLTRLRQAEVYPRTSVNRESIKL
jgi:hypothetical protein